MDITEKMSLQDMIEGDLKGHSVEAASPTPLFTINLPAEFGLDNESESLSSLLSRTQSVESLDVTSLFNNAGTNGSPNLSGLHQFLLKPTENGNPNLLVNPTTGLPVQSDLANIANSTTPSDSAEVNSVLQKNDVQMISPNHNVNLLNSLVNSNVPSSNVIKSWTPRTMVKPSPNKPAQPLQSIQNRGISTHQTLTQHLLLNNNFRKLQKDPNEKVWPKPVYSYSCLIAMALKNSETGALPVSEIYSFMTYVVYFYNEIFLYHCT